MFIKTQKKELIDAVGKQGGGFIPAEIMVCQSFELAEPDPGARKHWHEIEWKDHRSKGER